MPYIRGKRGGRGNRTNLYRKYRLMFPKENVTQFMSTYETREIPLGLHE